jgi:hypothetical protein
MFAPDKKSIPFYCFKTAGKRRCVIDKKAGGHPALRLGHSFGIGNAFTSPLF